MDYKEYSRIRSIVVKRNKRLAEKGLAPLLNFPTVKDIKNKFVDPDVAFKFTRNYYESGQMVSEYKRYEQTTKPKTFEELINDKPRRRKVSEKSQKDYLRSHAENELIAGRHERYVKAVKTMMANFKEKGRDLGIDITTMTPKEVQDLAEYLDYRFSQSDFTKKYVIQDFVRDYSKLKAQGYTTDQIKKDFEKFLIDRDKLKKNSKKNKGINASTFAKYWNDFINMNGSKSLGVMPL